MPVDSILRALEAAYERTDMFSLAAALAVQNPARPHFRLGLVKLVVDILWAAKPLGIALSRPRHQLVSRYPSVYFELIIQV